MDVLVDLTRRTTRLWYSTVQVAIVDLLTQSEILSEEQLAFKMKMNRLDVRKATGPLRLDKFVKILTKTESKRGGTRQIHTMFYYIDYKSVYDTIKYKLWKIQKHYRDLSLTVGWVVQKSRERNERDYKCPRCMQTFTQLEVTAFVYGPSLMFRCPYHRPDEAFFLVLADEKESDSHNKLTHFLRLMEPTIALLKHAESVKIPKFAPEAAMAQAEAAKLQFGRDGKVLPQAVAGAPGSTKDGVRMLGDVAEDTAADRPMVTVEIQDGQAASAAKLAADDAERERKKRQNALPAWHQSSTIVTAASASDGKQIRVDVTAAAALDIVEDSSATKATVNVVSSTVMSAAGDDETSTPAASTVVAGEEEEGADIMGYYDNYYASYVEENEDDEDEFVEVDMPEQGAEAVSVAPPEKQSALDMPSAAPETAADTFEDDEEDDEFIDVELPADGIAPKRKHDDDDDAEKDVATSARDTKRMKTASADQ